jgi:hypothetical protein
MSRKRYDYDGIGEAHSNSTDDDTKRKSKRSNNNNHSGNHRNNNNTNDADRLPSVSSLSAAPSAISSSVATSTASQRRATAMAAAAELTAKLATTTTVHLTKSRWGPLITTAAVAARSIPYMATATRTPSAVTTAHTTRGRGGAHGHNINRYAPIPSTSHSTATENDGYYYARVRLLFPPYALPKVLIDIIIEYYQSVGSLLLFGRYNNRQQIWSITNDELVLWYNQQQQRNTTSICSVQQQQSRSTTAATITSGATAAPATSTAVPTVQWVTHINSTRPKTLSPDTLYVLVTAAANGTHAMHAHHHATYSSNDDENAARLFYFSGEHTSGTKVGYWNVTNDILSLRDSPERLEVSTLVPWAPLNSGNYTRCPQFIRLTAPGRTHEILAIGGVNSLVTSYEEFTKVDCYNTITNTWHVEQCELPQQCESSGLAIDPTTHFLYMFGGSTRQGNVSSIQCYNPHTRMWSIPSYMQKERSRPIAVYVPTYKGFLILDGASMEFFDPMVNRCMAIPINKLQLPLGETDLTAAYVIDGTTMLVIISRHTTATTMWTATGYDDLDIYAPSATTPTTDGAAPIAGHIIDLSTISLDDLIDRTPPVSWSWQSLPLSSASSFPLTLSNSASPSSASSVSSSSSTSSPSLVSYTSQWQRLPPLPIDYRKDGNYWDLHCVIIPSHHHCQ